MARIEIAKLELSDRSVTPSNHLNISSIVGVGGRNERNDVMLIKALLFLNQNNMDVSDAKYWGASAIGLLDLPEITGNIDAESIQAIWDFQKRNASRLLSIDGKIHPASYQNRVIKNSLNSKVMAITLLNQQAYHAPIYLGVNNLEKAVKKIAPSIMFT